MTPAPDPASFRSEFPVFERVSYLNAGTEGPVPRAAADAARRRIDLEATRGRCGREYFDGLMELATRARAAYAEVLAAWSKHDRSTLVLTLFNRPLAHPQLSQIVEIS